VHACRHAAVNAGDNPPPPWRLTPAEYYTRSCNSPESNPTLDMHTPEITHLGRHRERRPGSASRRHIYSPPPAPYINKFASDTSALLVITRSQLTAAQCLPWFLIKAARATYSKVKSLHLRLSDLYSGRQP